MNVAHPLRKGPAKPRALRRLSWAVSMLAGGATLVALAVTTVSLLKERADIGTLVMILWLVLFAAILICLESRLHPICRRSDASHLWNQRFPVRTEQEVQRFLRTVGESLGYGARDWSKLRPEDDLSALHHQWSGGGGMELVELVMSVEGEYSLELPEEFLSTEKTLADLFAYVTRAATDRSKLAGTGPSQPSESLP